MSKLQHRRNGVRRTATQSSSPKFQRFSLSVTPVHESGHAVTHWLTADAMGLDPCNAVWRIEMHQPNDAGLPTTYGSLFSTEITVLAGPLGERLGSTKPGQGLAGAAAFRYCSDVIDAARSAGCDIDGWAMAKVMICLGGPVAEAKLTATEFWQIADGPGRDDMNDAVAVATLAGWTDEQFASVIDWAESKLTEFWSDSRHWNALLNLALELPVKGRMDGRKAWRIYSEALMHPKRIIIPQRRLESLEVELSVTA